MNYNIKEDYVSFEVAKLLKNKGFGEKSFAIYDDKGNFIDELYRFDGQFIINSILAPTSQMALKWLREIHKIYISINVNIYKLDNTPRYYIKINNDNLRSVYMDYYKAVDAAIKFVLEHLIN